MTPCGDSNLPQMVRASPALTSEVVQKGQRRVQRLGEQPVRLLAVAERARQLQRSDHQAKQRQRLRPRRFEVGRVEALPDVAHQGHQLSREDALRAGGPAYHFVEQGRRRTALSALVAVLRREVGPDEVLESRAIGWPGIEAVTLGAQLIGE